MAVLQAAAICISCFTYWFVQVPPPVCPADFEVARIMHACSDLLHLSFTIFWIVREDFSFCASRSAAVGALIIENPAWYSGLGTCLRCALGCALCGSVWPCRHWGPKAHSLMPSACATVWSHLLWLSFCHLGSTLGPLDLS